MAEKAETTRTFKYGDDVEIVVKRCKLRDQMDREFWNSLLEHHGVAETDLPYRRGYSKIMSRTASIKGLDIKIPTRSMTLEEIEAEFEKFIDLDDALADLWAEEGEAVNQKLTPKEEQGKSSEEASDPNSSSGGQDS